MDKIYQRLQAIAPKKVIVAEFGTTSGFAESHPDMKGNEFCPGVWAKAALSKMFEKRRKGDAFDYAKSVARPEGHHLIIGAKIHALFDKREIEKAEWLMDEFKSSYPSMASNSVFQMSVDRISRRARAA